MFRTILPRARAHTHRYPPRRQPYSTPPNAVPPSSRIDRLNRRLPKFLHKHTRALANAPISHITSFLILHELTAIIPLFGLAAYFHYTHWLPSWFAEGKWVLDGVERFGRYFRRKGWIEEGEAGDARREVEYIQLERKGVDDGDEVLGSDGQAIKSGKFDKAWDLSEGGVRLVVEFATAWAVTKALILPRVVLCVWGTPAFARGIVGPVGKAVGRWFGRGKKTSSGTGGKGVGEMGSEVGMKGRGGGDGKSSR